MSTTPPGPAVPPAGFIDLTIQSSPLTSTPVTPTVRVNGQPMRVHYGLNRIAMPPGRAYIEVECQWLLAYGRASTDVEIVEGAAVPVFYAPPYHQFARRGAIGHQEQSRPGLGGMLAICAAIVLVLIGLVVLGVTLSG